MRVLLGCSVKSFSLCSARRRGEMSADVAADDVVNHTSGFSPRNGVNTCSALVVFGDL